MSAKSFTHSIYNATLDHLCFENVFTLELNEKIVFQETAKANNVSAVLLQDVVLMMVHPLRFSDIRKCLQFNYCLCCVRHPSGASSCEAAQDEKHTRGKKEKEEINGEKGKDECVLTVGMSLDPQVMGRFCPLKVTQMLRALT